MKYCHFDIVPYRSCLPCYSGSCSVFFLFDLSLHSNNLQMDDDVDAYDNPNDPFGIPAAEQEITVGSNETQPPVIMSSTGLISTAAAAATTTPTTPFVIGGGTAAVGTHHLSGMPVQQRPRFIMLQRTGGAGTIQAASGIGSPRPNIKVLQ